MRFIRDVFGALFLLLALGLALGVLFGVLGVTIQQQQVWATLSVSFGVIALVFTLGGLSGIPAKLDAMEKRAKAEREEADRERRATTPRKTTFP